MLTVKKCCCGCSLKGGTCALLILSLIFAGLQLVNIFSGAKYISATSVAVRVTILLICIAGLYAVQEKKPTFIIPFAILQVFGIFYLVYVLILLLFFQQLITEIAQGVAEEDPSSKNAKDLEKVDAFFFFSIIITILMGVLQYYFFVVVYSFYKELKREKTSSPPAYA